MLLEDLELFRHKYVPKKYSEKIIMQQFEKYILKQSKILKISTKKTPQRKCWVIITPQSLLKSKLFDRFLNEWQLKRVWQTETEGEGKGGEMQWSPRREMSIVAWSRIHLEQKWVKQGEIVGVERLISILGCVLESFLTLALVCPHSTQIDQNRSFQNNLFQPSTKWTEFGSLHLRLLYKVMMRFASNI